MSQQKVRSTTQRRGSSWKPLALPERLMMHKEQAFGMQALRAGSRHPALQLALIAAVREDNPQVHQQM